MEIHPRPPPCNARPLRALQKQPGLPSGIGAARRGSAPGHLAGSQQARKAVLPQRLVDADGHGVAQVQAAGLADHGQADAAVPVPLPESQRQSGGLLAEEQPAVGGEPGLLIGPGRLGGGEPQVPLRLGAAAEKVLQILVIKTSTRFQ